MKASTRSVVFEVLTDLSVGLFFILFLMAVGAFGVLLVQELIALVKA